MTWRGRRGEEIALKPYADPLAIPLARGPVGGTVNVPGSKSYTNRALPVAALADGTSRLTGALDSEDTRVMMESLRRLGIAVTPAPAARTIAVTGCGGRVPTAQADLFLANSGTSIRFLAALVALGNGTYRLDGVARMRERPIADLLAGLTALGADARSLAGNGCPPIEIRAGGLRGGQVAVRGDVSSQFLSALLLVAPLAEAPTTITVAGPLVSQPYIDMTLATMAAFGIRAERDGYQAFHFPGRGRYQAADYAIEPDASAASYFFGAAAVTGGTITVPHLGSGSLQGDLGFVQLLAAMGCRVEQAGNATTVAGGRLHGLDVDLCHLSDTVPTLAAVACFADAPTRIRNVAHIRRKETDRIAALAAELRKTGTGVDEHADGLTIHPGPMHGATFDTYNDHRMAMSLALIGLRVPGVCIGNPGCTDKTYPDFFDDFFALDGVAGASVHAAP